MPTGKHGFMAHPDKHWNAMGLSDVLQICWICMPGHGAIMHS